MVFKLIYLEGKEAKAEEVVVNKAFKKNEN